jgi:hypothetical protein
MLMAAIDPILVARDRLGEELARLEYQIRDRLSFIRFLRCPCTTPCRTPRRLSLPRAADQDGDRAAVPALRCGAARRRMSRHAGQIVDATVVEARRRRLTEEEKTTFVDNATVGLPFWLVYLADDKQLKGLV